MSIEYDMSKFPHSRGVQCQVSLESSGVVHVSRDAPIPYLVIFILMYNALHHGEGVNNQRHKLDGTPPVFYRCHLPFNFHGSQGI